MSNDTSDPIGLCSRARAEELMGAAAVAGGAIYVDCPPVPGITVSEDDPWAPRVYLCEGTLPNGEPVPTRELDRTAVLSALRAEIARLERLRAVSDMFDGMLAELRAVAARVASAHPSR